MGPDNVSLDENELPDGSADWNYEFQARFGGYLCRTYPGGSPVIPTIHSSNLAMDGALVLAASTPYPLPICIFDKVLPVAQRPVPNVGYPQFR